MPLRTKVHHLCISMISTSKQTRLQPQVTRMNELLSKSTTSSSVSFKQIAIQVLQDHSMTLAKAQQVKMTDLLQRNIPSSN